MGFFYTAPSSAPLMVRATLLSSTNILVQWQGIPLVEINGNLSYEVLYSYSQGPAQVDRTAQMSIILENLAESELYMVQVRAVTSAGLGPYSDPVFQMTDKQGIHCYITSIMKGTEVQTLSVHIIGGSKGSGIRRKMILNGGPPPCMTFSHTLWET